MYCFTFTSAWPRRAILAFSSWAWVCSFCCMLRHATLFNRKRVSPCPHWPRLLSFDQECCRSNSMVQERIALRNKWSPGKRYSIPFDDAQLCMSLCWRPFRRLNLLFDSCWAHLRSNKLCLLKEPCTFLGNVKIYTCATGISCASGTNNLWHKLFPICSSPDHQMIQL